MRWEKNFGLPIHRIGNEKKQSIFAYEDELEIWLKEQKKIKLNINKTNVVVLLFKNKTLYLLPLLILILSILFIFIKRNGLPTDFNIEGSFLVILDKKGYELWRYDTGIKNLSIDEYRSRFQEKKNLIGGPYLCIKDLNQDDKPEVLFSVQVKGDAIGEGKLFCFDHRGNILWDFLAGRNMTWGDKEYFPNFRIGAVDTCDFINDGTLEILVISYQYPQWPCQVVLIDFNGDVIGEYWNSGHILDYAFPDFNYDGIKDLFIIGCNNEGGNGCLIAFDSRNVHGSSPQSEKRFSSEDLGPGTQKIYVRLPRTDVDLAESSVDPAITAFFPVKDRIVVVTDFSHLFYEFNFAFELLDVKTSHRFEQMHKEALRDGKINSVLNDQYMDNLKQSILYFQGKEWRSFPLKINWEAGSSR